MPCRQYNAIKNSRSLSLGDCRFRKLPHPVTVLRCRPTSPLKNPVAAAEKRRLDGRGREKIRHPVLVRLLD